jgi:cytochrome b561
MIDTPALPHAARRRRFSNIERWGPISQLLHWTIVVLIVWMAYLGLTMTDLPNGPAKISVYTLHKSIGLTILGLVSLRVLWRAWAGAPLALQTIPRWQHRIAELTHIGLYVLLFAIPLSGWLVNSSSGFPLRWFGLFRVPQLAARDHDLHEFAEDLHEWLFWALVVVALAHAAAAIYHHLFQRDATLSRMLPDGWLRAPASEESRDA